MELKNLIKGRGLKYHDSVAREVTENSKKVTKYIPRERPLREDDILSHRVRGTIVTIVTKDGQRYHIDTTEKQRKPASKKETGKDELHPREETLLEKGMKATAKGYSHGKIFVHKDKLLEMDEDEFNTLVEALVKEQEGNK